MHMKPDLGSTPFSGLSSIPIRNQAVKTPVSRVDLKPWAGWNSSLQLKKPELMLGLFNERMAATYSRGVYKTTTIGKTAFDGRVRNGNGSDHSFMATIKF